MGMSSAGRGLEEGGLGLGHQREEGWTRVGNRVGRAGHQRGEVGRGRAGHQLLSRLTGAPLACLSISLHGYNNSLVCM